MSTDYKPCPFIEKTKPDYLIIPKDLEQKFINNGIKKKILKLIGIPISTRFITKAKNIKDKLNIKNDTKIILIMLGSMGFGNAKEIITPLLEEKKRNHNRHIWYQRKTIQRTNRIQKQKLITT